MTDGAGADLFGRERDLEKLEGVVARACAGHGSIVLLTGEPGIGKSTLARQAAACAAVAGMRLLTGRCWEGGGATPYWPWVQVFRGLGATPFEDLIREDGGDSQQRRFHLFDAATRALTDAAAERPLVILLDDLHAADLPSLLLLLFLSRQIATSPVFVLGTSRDAEVRATPEAADVMAKIGREGEVFPLRRLGRDDVTAWVASSGGRAPSPDEVFRITEGNPLFVREVLRVGTNDQRALATDGMKAALDEHLRKLPTETRAILEAAAILGRDFCSRDVAEMIGANHETVTEAMRLAVELGVVEAGPRDHFQFTHVLLRDRLYATLPVARRNDLHWKAGLAAEAAGESRAMSANHLLEGADAGDRQRAAAAALAAADHATRTLAFEVAVAMAERGLRLLGGERSVLSCRLEIAVGEGLICSGAVAAGHARCVHAAEVAKALGAGDELAQAALVYASEMLAGPSVDPVMVRLLEEALSAAGPAKNAISARVGVRLAAALMPSRNEEEANRVGALSKAAQASARRFDDPETLLYVLELAGRGGLGMLLPSDERFVLVEEVVTLAKSLSQRLTLLRSLPAYAVLLLERGRRAEADAALALTVDLHMAIDYPPARWRLPMLRAAFALFDGAFAEAERLGDEALALGGQAAALEWASQRHAVIVARGDPAAVAPVAEQLVSIFGASSWTAAGKAWVLGAMGRREEALATLRQAPQLPQGFGPIAFFAAEAAAFLEDCESAAWIDGHVQKGIGDRPFFWGPSSGYAAGPIARVQGEMARLLGRKEEARRRFEEAIALCQRVGAKPFLQLSLAALARLDAESGVASVPTPKDASPPRSAARELSLRREGDLWALVAGAGASYRLKTSKGLAYLSELLAHPGREVHVLTLVGLDHGAGDAGVILDARAKAEYGKRLQDLQSELDEAESFGDEARAGRARDEIEMLASQLAGAVGLGGRDRRAASDAERARINVQRRLKDAIDSIGRCDADLGRYLSAAVKTGTYCAYTPI